MHEGLLHRILAGCGLGTHYCMIIRILAGVYILGGSYMLLEIFAVRFL